MLHNSDLQMQHFWRCHLPQYMRCFQTKRLANSMHTPGRAGCPTQAIDLRCLIPRTYLNTKDRRRHHYTGFAAEPQRLTGAEVPEIHVQNCTKISLLHTNMLSAISAGAGPLPLSKLKSRNNAYVLKSALANIPRTATVASLTWTITSVIPCACLRAQHVERIDNLPPDPTNHPTWRRIRNWGH